MGRELKVGLKAVSLNGRGADYARRALSLPAGDGRLKVADTVPLVYPVDPDWAAVLTALFGPIARPRRIDIACLPAGSIIDIHTTEGNHGEVYRHTEANPLWWTPARVLAAWLVVSVAERTGTDVNAQDAAQILHECGKVKQ